MSQKKQVLNVVPYALHHDSESDSGNNTEIFAARRGQYKRVLANNLLTIERQSFTHSLIQVVETFLAFF